MKAILLSVFMTLSLPICAATQDNTGNVLSVSTEISTDNLIAPESFDTDTRNLMDNWYLQRYAVLDSMSRIPVMENTPDEVYIQRLQSLPHVIEMPFNSVVKRFIEMYAVSKPRLVEKMLGMSLYYMPIFEEALNRHQLPLELKYLPVIESALDPTARSRSGAVGLWQFMPTTATGEGLEVNSLVDERCDPVASSEAAAVYLKKLYNMYDDWHLALAAYNCGPGNVNKALRRAGGGRKDFWQIYRFLPEETRTYVPAFIAANYIMNYYGAHGISPALARRPLVTDTVMVSNRVHFNQIAEVLGVSIDALRILNPQYKTDVIPGNIKPYPLVLPSVQAYCYVANEDSILAHDPTRYSRQQVAEPGAGNRFTGSDELGEYVDEITYTNHTVRRGETLNSIGQHYNVAVEEIRTANNLSSSRVRRGQTLRIPVVRRTYTSRNPNPVRTDSIGNGVPEITVADNNTSPSDSIAAATTPAPAVAQQTQQQAPRQQTQTPRQQRQQQQTYYRVRSGDSLSRIAARYHVTVAQIKRANNLRSDMIHPGQRLLIPTR